MGAKLNTRSYGTMTSVADYKFLNIDDSVTLKSFQNNKYGSGQQTQPTPAQMMVP